jgi:chromate transporter
MAIHIGHERAGWKDLLLQDCVLSYQPLCLQESLLGFIKIMDSYLRFNLLYGIKPAIIAIILGAIFPLAKKSLKTVRLGIIGIIVLLLSLLQFNEIALLLALDSWLYFGTYDQQRLE